jgi:hypothetical protein
VLLWRQAIHSSYRRLPSGEYVDRPEEIGFKFETWRYKNAEVNSDGIAYHWNRLSRSTQKPSLAKSKLLERKLQACDDSDDEEEAKMAANNKAGSPSRFGYAKLGA